MKEAKNMAKTTDEIESLDTVGTSIFQIDGHKLQKK